MGILKNVPRYVSGVHLRHVWEPLLLDWRFNAKVRGSGCKSDLGLLQGVWGWAEGHTGHMP